MGAVDRMEEPGTEFPLGLKSGGVQLYILIIINDFITFYYDFQLNLLLIPVFQK